MKRLICIILSFLLLVPVFGCQRQDRDTSYTFYYPRADYGYDTLEGKFHNSIVETESREDISNQSLSHVLEIYLDGPTDLDLANPFSEDLSVVSVNVDGQALSIVVTDHLSELTGIYLFIACACLGQTGMELTNTDSVQISCEKALLDGKRAISFNKDTILFNDAATATTHEQE